jgi:hypothetical protein
MVQSGSGKSIGAVRSTVHRRLRSSHRQPGRAGRVNRAVVPDALVQPPEEQQAGLGLPRLLEIARITPAQALALGVDVLTGLESRHAAGGGHGRLRLEAVHVGADGRAQLIDRVEPNGRHLPETEGSDLPTAGALLDHLGGAARRSTRKPDPRAVDQLGALDGAVAEATRPGGDLTVVAALLRDGEAPGGAAARAELARLVAAASGRDAGPRPRPAGTTPRAPAPQPAPAAGRRPGAATRAVAARTWKWIISLAVLAMVIALEFAFLRDQITRDIEAVLEAGGTGTMTSAAPARPPAPVVPPAPAAAGAVIAVDLRAVRPCTPGERCDVRLQVRLRPQAEPQTVGWAFQILDRCTGAVVTTPGGTLTIPPNGDRADAVGTVALPPGDALAVLALTGRPTAASSAPLPVPDQGRCAAPAEPFR